MTFAELATKRRVTVIMFTTAVILFGLVSLGRLNVNLLPDIAYPTLTVRTELTGAAPQEIENLLTKPIEESVGVIKNVRQVRSVSRSGQSDVILEFLWGTNMDLAAVDVREKLDTLQLPLEAKRPLLLRFDPSSEPIIRLALMDATAEESLGESSEARLKWLRRFAEDNLKTDLEGVEGTAAVKVSGGLEDEIQILVDEDKVAALGYSIDTIAQRIRAENVNLSGGRLEQGSQRFLVRTLNEFTSVDDIARTIIATPDGRTVYLDDVARVVRGYKEREAVTRVDGRESVELAIYKEGDGNTVQIAARLQARLDDLRETLPDGLELRGLYDQSRFINAAISQVRNAALFGGLLAVLVLYFFLRDLRSTLIIGMTIPVSVIGTFIAMYGFDLTLNIMSLGGIALAVGLLVDNSIVVLESIFRRREQGEDVVSAAQRGTNEVGTAITAATLTTIAVFFPMVFVSGIAGQLFRDQALTVTFALAFSLLVAVTLIPMLASIGGGERFQEASSDERPGLLTRGFSFVLRWIARIFGAIVWVIFSVLLRPFTWLFQKSYDAIAHLYRPILAGALRHRLLIVAVAIGIFAGAMTLVPRLGTELIPQLSQGEFNVDLRLAPGAPLASTDRAAREVQLAAQGIDGYERSFSVAGTGNRLDASPVDAGENTAQLSVKLTDGATRATEIEAMRVLRDHLNQQAGVEYEFSRPSLFSFSTPLEVVVRGYDLDKLQTTSERIAERLRAGERFADVRTTMQSGQPEIQILFDHERAARLGLAVRDIADEVVAKVRGELATRYTLRDRKIDVLVRSLDTEQASVQEVRELIVNPLSDRPVTLEAVADIRIAAGPAEIRRANQERVALVQANLAYGDLGEAVAELDALLGEVALPGGISAEVGGQNEEMDASFESMRFALLMAVFLVYLVMASQFESLIHPFVILLTVPLALVGAVLGLTVTGTSINVVALIGVIMLVGIVVNNAIVLVDYINQARARGMQREQAIMEAGQARLRPILMTTATTALGLLPMALGIGEGAEIRAPMAITVIGGLLVATVLTLVVIPVVYSLLDRKQYAAPVSNPALATTQA
ncbi:MAG: efflux RND transporter permease subunit [Pseudomonadota bacterium]